MLVAVEALGSIDDEDGHRRLYLQELESIPRWPALRDDRLWREVVEDDATGFALMLACDAMRVSTESLSEFAGYCMDHGVFWVSTIGPDCERVHDLFDEVEAARGIEDRGFVMTAWHEREPFEDALEVLWHAFPDEGKRNGPARVAVVVGSDEWVRAVRKSAAAELDE